MEELAKDPNRRFIYVEQAFFQRWWRQQDADMQARVRKFVDEGQLEFISGGWVMHDEAAPVYTDMIAQVRSRGGVCERRMPARSSGVPFLAVVPKCDRLAPFCPLCGTPPFVPPPPPPPHTHTHTTTTTTTVCRRSSGTATSSRSSAPPRTRAWGGRCGGVGWRWHSSSRCGMAGPARVGVGWQGQLESVWDGTAA